MLPSKVMKARAKDARQTPADESARIRPKKKKRGARPWHVIGAATCVLFSGREWTWYRCATKERAEEMLEKIMRSHPGMERNKFRIEYKEVKK